MINLIFVTIGGGCVGYAIGSAWSFWHSRRRPTRQDAPTHGKWVTPKPFWDDNDRFR